MWEGAEFSRSMTDRLVRTLEQDTPPKSQTKDQLISTTSTFTDAKLLHIQCCRRGSKVSWGRGRHTATVEPMGAQAKLTGVSRNNGGEFGAVEL